MMSIASTAINAAKAIGKEIAANPKKAAAAAGIAGAGAIATQIDTSGARITPVAGGKYRVTTKNKGIIDALSSFGGDTTPDKDGLTTFTLSAGEYERAKPFLDKVTDPAEEKGEGAKDTPAEEAAEIKK